MKQAVQISIGILWIPHSGPAEPDPLEGKEVGVQDQELGNDPNEQDTQFTEPESAVPEGGGGRWVEIDQSLQ